VAGAVFLDWNRRIIYRYGASDRRSWPLRPNNLIFWEAIRRGCASGARSLDFGRSDWADEGLRAFKSSWGAVEEELRYASYGNVQWSSEAAPGRLLRPVLRIAPTWVSRSLGEVFYRFAA
jgi:Acetyltransferase (GNAT) domain